MAGKTLFLLRHANALNDSGLDKNRALSPKGVEDAKALGRLMDKQNFVPDMVVCSPAKRTRHTLKSLQSSLKTPQASFPEILYNGSAGDYLYEIQKIDDKYSKILIIAHNPSIYELVILLATQGSETLMQKLSEGYPPASLSVINCKCESWANIQPAGNELLSLMNPIDYSDLLY